jgi:transposase
VPSRRRYKIGRPTKRTKAVVKVLFDAIKEGVPYKLACMAAGITYECFNNWRQNDPDFDRQVEELVAKPAIDLFKIIREQAPETWQAGAWTLERRFPEMFAKPEAQLNIVAQAAVVNGNSTPHNVQMVVVSDLEFVGLKRHPAYKHRPGVAREVEQVSPELAGTLERENANIVVTSQSAAEVRADRHARIRAKTEALLKEAKPNNAKGESSIQKQLSPDLDGSLHREDGNIVVVSESKAETHNCRLAEGRKRLEARHKEPLAAAVPAPPTDGALAQEPLPTKPSSWWRPFIFGGAVIPKAEATLAVRIILNELRITVDERALDFGTDNVVKSAFSKVLEQLSGSDLGWRTMVQIYERQQVRERLRAHH